MATSADVLAKYLAYKTAFDAELAAYGHSVSLVPTTAIDGSTIAGFGSTRPLVDPEADLDTYNTQVANRNTWDSSLIAAQTAYTAAMNIRRARELDLIGAIPANQWITVEGIGVPSPVYLGYRGPSGYPMIRSTTIDPNPAGSGTTNLFTDISGVAITLTYSWYQQAIGYDMAADAAIASLGTRPGYPPTPPVSPAFVGVTPADEATYRILSTDQATWDNSHNADVFYKTRTTIDLGIYLFRLVLTLPPNMWVQVSIPLNKYVGYRLADTTPTLVTHNGSGLPPFPM